MSSSLEIFILAMVDGGLNTPYDLHARAGLSIGATHPALKRLQKKGLLQAGAEGARRRREFQLTKAGRHELKAGSAALQKQAGEEIAPDLESVLRTASLALMRGRKRPCIKLLKEAAKDRSKKSQERLSDAAGFQKELNEVPNAYRWMLAVCDAARLEAEGRALVRIARELRPGSGHRGAAESHSRTPL